MNNIEYFTKLNESISLFAEEVSVRNGFIEENLFDTTNTPTEVVVRFVTEILNVFQEPIQLNRLQQFSFQAADGISYDEPKFMAVFSGGREEIKNHNIDASRPHDDYCVNYFLHSKKKAFKFYDLDVERHATPELLEGTVYAFPYGHGVSELPRKDVYFVHTELFRVAEHFGLPAPTVDELHVIDTDNTIPKVFGLSYDTVTLAPLKLKRYFYPRDPLMKYFLYDEVDNERNSI
ncbi:hypothetical protein E4H12_12825 [Candidatus Thorarchaeota archaeon]|nr:MAG: hypothetical protein E4H12_12825 [Candidatus Thorarchaeota archaeon]